MACELCYNWLWCHHSLGHHEFDTLMKSAWIGKYLGTVVRFLSPQCQIYFSYQVGCEVYNVNRWIKFNHSSTSSFFVLKRSLEWYLHTLRLHSSWLFQICNLRIYNFTAWWCTVGYTAKIIVYKYHKHVGERKFERLCKKRRSTPENP